VVRFSRRVLSTVVGVALATTTAADVAAALAAGADHRPGAKQASLTGDQRYVATADTTVYSPSVASEGKLVSPDLLIAAPSTLTRGVIAKVRATKGVRSVEVVDAAQALVSGKRVGVLGVDPSTFRDYTPSPSAASDPLWRNIADGDIAVSFDMGENDSLPLGSTTEVGDSSHQVSVRVGAYATMGISQVDAVVSRETARHIGLPSGNALVVSAPKANLTTLRKTLGRLLPKAAKTEVLQAALGGTTTPVGATGGEVMSAGQVATVIRAAESQIGVPYVWGGESVGHGFDCSGLVQWAFAQAGIRMPRTADIQAFTGWRIPLSQAEPGDLLTWRNDPTFNGVSHIAIYLGHGRMVVAPHTGLDVMIQVPYMTNFWGAIRVNPQLAAKIAAED
jgi:cell wall-associated NlpC family hydrolase